MHFKRSIPPNYHSRNANDLLGRPFFRPSTASESGLGSIPKRCELQRSRLNNIEASSTQQHNAPSISGRSNQSAGMDMLSSVASRILSNQLQLNDNGEFREVSSTGLSSSTSLGSATYLDGQMPASSQPAPPQVEARTDDQERFGIDPQIDDARFQEPIAQEEPESGVAIASSAQVRFDRLPDLSVNDEGRFPNLTTPAPDSADQSFSPYAGYSPGRIKVLKPKSPQYKADIELYLNASNEGRKAYKASRLCVEPLTQAEYTELGLAHLPKRELLAKYGLRAKRDLPAHEFLGIFEGVLLLTDTELKARLNMMRGVHQLDASDESADSANYTKLTAQSWDLLPEDRHHQPIVSAVSTIHDPALVGCMLGYTNIALTKNLRGTLGYNSKKINVISELVTTDVAAQLPHPLKSDMVAYYTSKKVSQGQLLCMRAWEPADLNKT